MINIWVHKENILFSAHFSSVTRLCSTLCYPKNWSTSGFPVQQQLPEPTKLMSFELVLPPNHLIICCPLFQLPLIFPIIRVFSNESALLIRWSKYWSFSFNISPSNEHLGLISFRMDRLDFIVVQGTLKSLLQHHISKRQFFSAQLSLYSNSHIHTWLLEMHSLD